MPSTGLYDPALRGMSAEQVYDKIATDRRRMRKLASLRGYGLPDILPRPLAHEPARGVDLDELSSTAAACVTASGITGHADACCCPPGYPRRSVPCRFLLLSRLHAISIWCPAFLHVPVLAWFPFNGERWPRLFIGGSHAYPATVGTRDLRPPERCACLLPGSARYVLDHSHEPAGGPCRSHRGRP